MKQGWTRRELLQAGAVLGAATALGCSSDDAAEERPPGPLGQIDTFVILMMENRSFDHVLGSLKLSEGRVVDGLTGSESNPAPAGGAPVGVFKLDNFRPEDPPHGWNASHAQFAGGRNDGFVTAHAGASQHEVMGYHVRDQLPTTYSLADQYCVCDRWFASVMGPTWPNRFFLHGGTSHGEMSNDRVIDFRGIFHQLEEARIPAKNYFHDLAWMAGGYRRVKELAPIEEFFRDAAAGTLPRVSIIDPMFGSELANDDHPDHDMRLGQALIAAIHAALAQSPQWERCLFVLTYDEHGGFYDHVPPPTVVDPTPGFEQLGFRVPTIVAGGRVKRGAVVSDLLEHTSVVATITRRFGLPPLNARVAAATDLSVCLAPLPTATAAGRVQPVTIPLATLRRPALRPMRAHEELIEAAAGLPRGLDRRSDARDIGYRVLGAAARLGAVHIV